MANTRDTLGDQATLDGLVNGALTDLEESEVSLLREYAFREYDTPLSIRFPNVTHLQKNTFYSADGIAAMGADAFPGVEVIDTTAFYYVGSATPMQIAVFPNVHSVSSLPAAEIIDFPNQAVFPKISVASIGNTYLETVFIRYEGSEPIGNASALAYGISRLNDRSGAIFVPASKLAEYKADSRYDAVSIFPISAYPLSDYSTITDTWAEISEAGANGTHITKYKLGDTKSLTVDGVTYYAQIVAFDTDDKADGSGKAPITWQIRRNLLNLAPGQGSTWIGSAIRTQLNNTLLPTFSNKDYIIAVNKRTATTDSSQSSGGLPTISTSTDSLWLPSVWELTGDTTQGEGKNTSERPTLPKYTDWFNDAKRRCNKGASATAGFIEYYTRTLSTATYNSKWYRYFFTINTSGSVTIAAGDAVKNAAVFFCT